MVWLFFSLLTATIFKTDPDIPKNVNSKFIHKRVEYDRYSGWKMEN